ncbi:MAG: hypothetical protein USCAAHI_01435 [Beijerinckiaceae bacterium]|nr:MAG: hypothetical protein USCAAHI_01435 [Beijerinckiaceae bacterium]
MDDETLVCLADLYSKEQIEAIAEALPPCLRRRAAINRVHCAAERYIDRILAPAPPNIGKELSGLGVSFKQVRRFQDLSPEARRCVGVTDETIRVLSRIHGAVRLPFRPTILPPDYKKPGGPHPHDAARRWAIAIREIWAEIHLPRKAPARGWPRFLHACAEPLHGWRFLAMPH